MNTKDVAVHCTVEHGVVGHLKVKAGEFKLTVLNFISMFTPIDIGHRLNRSEQSDGQFARCGLKGCNGILEIHPDGVEFLEKPAKGKGEPIDREAARALAVNLAQSSGAVHRTIHNRTTDNHTPVLLGKSRMRVS